MYPLLLNAPLKDNIWGGQRLKKEYGFHSNCEIIAEAWVLANRADGQSAVLNGELKGKTLGEAIEIFGNECLGVNSKRFEYFPLLIKLIDANKKLSVQVHPDDDYALKYEGEFGKTEMWYVIDCKAGASLIYGFNTEISKEEFERRIRDNTLTEVCNYVNVEKGDVFFIPAGTLHAIGEGILIAEVQQNSNTTYRVSDYGRLGADGKPRELHIDKAIEVTDRVRPRMPYGEIGEVTVFGKNRERMLASCDKFTVKLLEIDDEYPVFERDTFVSLIVLSGSITVKWNGGELTAQKGASVFIPAGIDCNLFGKAEVLYSFV